MLPGYSKIYVIIDTFSIQIKNVGIYKEDSLIESEHSLKMIIVSSFYSQHIFKELFLPINCNLLHHLDDANLILWSQNCKNLFWLDLFRGQFMIYMQINERNVYFLYVHVKIHFMLNKEILFIFLNKSIDCLAARDCVCVKQNGKKHTQRTPAP